MDGIHIYLRFDEESIILDLIIMRLLLHDCAETF